jgi:hypothetical protein
METKRYSAYNSTRGTHLNGKLSLVDRELEPLKFLELLIGGLGLDSESGLWLKPLACPPRVPRVFPFDLVYLDRDQQVIQAAEVFPNGEFPPYTEDVASALILPLHAASSTQTRPNDQLLVGAVEGPAEQSAGEAAPPDQKTPELVPEALTQMSVLALRDATVDTSAPMAMAETSSESGATKNKAPNLTLAEPIVASNGSTSTKSWELPLEGFWTPAAESISGSNGDSMRIKRGAAQAGGTASAASARIAPVLPPAAPHPPVQSVGSTVAQYRTWQVSNSTVPNAAPTSSKLPAQKSEPKQSPDPKLIARLAETGKGLGGKTTSTARPTQAVTDPDARQESNGGGAEIASETSNAMNPSVSTPAGPLSGALLGDTEGVSVSNGSAPSEEPVENGAATSASPGSITPEPVVTPLEASLPEWIATPDGAPPVVIPPAPPAVSRTSQSPTLAMRSKQERLVLDPLSRVDRPTAVAGPRDEKKAEPASHLPSVPEMIAGLKDALLSLGKAARSQAPARSQQSVQTRLSAWMNPEALHRDRRRAVRRTVPGMVAFYFTGGAPQPYTVADISATGFYLVTRDQWMPQTMIQMTLQKPASDGKPRKESITVLTRIVRKGSDGIGAEFIMPESLDPHSRDIKPGRATDRMALARFLFSVEFPDSFEVLGCFITPRVEQAGRSLKPVSPAP